MVKVPDKDRQDGIPALDSRAWQWANAAAAPGSRRCGWPARTCRGARATRCYEDLNRVLNEAGFDAGRMNLTKSVTC